MRHLDPVRGPWALGEGAVWANVGLAAPIMEAECVVPW